MNKIIQGDALGELERLEDKSINMCMTSPPYWALRDYGTEVETIWDENKTCEHNFEIEEIQAGTQHWNQGGKVIPYKEREIKNEKIMKVGFCNKCGAWKGQLGLEPTFDLYIKHLCDIFDEVKRVLRDDGTCWVNLGDTYFGSGKGAGGDISKSKEVYSFKDKEKRKCQNCGKEFDGWKFQNFCGSACSGVDNTPREVKGKLPDKTLTMIPFRFAIEMVNRGWILRNTIIWHKRNCMPSSVKDRFTVDFEYLFFFSKKKKYYFETQYEPHKLDSIKRLKQGFNENQHFDYKKRTKKHLSKDQERSVRQGFHVNRDPSQFYNPEGRNKRTVWTINPKPFSEAHFAVYPEELCETPIKAGCPEFVCNKCKRPREKIITYTKENIIKTNARGELRPSSGEDIHLTKSFGYKEKYNSIPHFKGLTKCGCNSEFISGIVIDPFFGSGTTGLVALKQNKKFIGIELNKEYIEIANKRLKPYLEQTKIK